MGADAKLTGSDYDLDPNDVVVDDEADGAVTLQNIDWILRTFRGEYPDDVAVGVDYLTYATRKDTPAAIIAADVQDNVRRIPTVRGVSVTTTSRLGRTLSFSLTGQLARSALSGNILVSTELSAQPGGDSPVAQYLTLRRN